MDKISIYSWNPKSLWPGQVRNPMARLSWSTGNFGDLYNFDLVRHLYGVEGQIRTHGRKALFAGSTLHRAQRGDLVAGVGARDPRRKVRSDPMHVYGLRGNLSLSTTKEQLGNLPNMRFLGDPGIIASDVYDCSNLPSSTFGVTAIPHYKDYETWREMGWPPDQLLNPDCLPSLAYARIASSEAVVTSSLHGLVFAHSAGIPVTLVRPLKEPFFKFEDYLSTVTEGRPEIFEADFALSNLVKLVGTVGIIDKKTVRNGLPKQSELVEFFDKQKGN